MEDYQKAEVKMMQEIVWYSGKIYSPKIQSVYSIRNFIVKCKNMQTSIYRKNFAEICIKTQIDTDLNIMLLDHENNYKTMG